MRNLGLNFFWQDKYAKNLFAKTFSAEENNIKNYGLITAFEVMEHLEDPIKELEKLFNLSDNILISTELLPEHKPKPNEWHYFALEHGQHIGFFSKKTMQFIANKYGFNYYTNESDIHLFTKKKISKFLFKIKHNISRSLQIYISFKKSILNVFISKYNIFILENLFQSILKLEDNLIGL